MIFSTLLYLILGECVEKFPNTNTDRPYSGAETAEKCKDLEGTWVDFHNYLEITDKTEAQCTGSE